MDARGYIRLIEEDADRRRKAEWDAMWHRPDASPLALVERRPWTERVIGLRWLIRSGKVADRAPSGTRRRERRPRATPLG